MTLYYDRMQPVGERIMNKLQHTSIDGIACSELA